METLGSVGCARSMLLMGCMQGPEQEPPTPKTKPVQYQPIAAWDPSTSPSP